ncbi:50S ribosomal protein L34 [Patescibacteria group bacterium]|nr:50S ribosomal protein L34 [Patescibacteria group bacterium]MBU4162049.1 50S ribosomal protein L34 [Patescibacteria group bacterium]
MAITYKQNKKKRKKKHGFLKRSATSDGRKILQNRRKKGRKRITV